MKTTLLLLSLITITSCTNKDNFKYVENIKEKVSGSKSVYHTTESRITAANDTLAYIEAYRKFKLSQRITEELLAGRSTIPREIISFQLFNSKGKNISDISFKTKDFEQKKADSTAAALELSYRISTEGNLFD